MGISIGSVGPEAKIEKKNEKKKDQILITSKHGMQFENYMLTHVVTNLHNTHSFLVSVIIQILRLKF